MDNTNTNEGPKVLGEALKNLSIGYNQPKDVSDSHDIYNYPATNEHDVRLKELYYENFDKRCKAVLWGLGILTVGGVFVVKKVLDHKKEMKKIETEAEKTWVKME